MYQHFYLWLLHDPPSFTFSTTFLGLEVKSFAVPVEQDRFNQRHHVSTGVVTCTYDGHVDGLWR